MYSEERNAERLKQWELGRRNGSSKRLTPECN